MNENGKRKENETYDYLVKVVVIGDSAVGKTNILLRLVNQTYRMTHTTTIGVDFKIKTINTDGTKIKMQIWDTAGQQRFKTITQTYYKNAAGIALVYSVGNRKTFESIESWMRQINEKGDERICKIIVGNKCDCSETQRQVTVEEGKRLADRFGVAFLEASAKENINITPIFEILAQKIKSQIKQSEVIQPSRVTLVEKQPSKRKQCC